MRRVKPWHKLGPIVFMLVVVPLAPIGLLMLWTSPRSIRKKALISVAFILLLLAASAGAVKTGIYARFADPYVPEYGYDVTRDSRNEYRIKEILPVERKVFVSVVQELRGLGISNVLNKGMAMTVDDVQPESQVFEKVADDYGLDTETVQEIYIKVTSILAASRKK